MARPAAPRHGWGEALAGGSGPPLGGRHRRRPVGADSVVIGGGVLGLSTAYWLAVAGHDVSVVDVAELGTGTSARCTGILMPAGPLEDLSLLGQECPALASALRPSGQLSLLVSAPLMDVVSDEVRTRPPSMEPLHLLSRDQCEDVLGRAVATEVLGGRWLPSAATIDPIELLDRLAGLCEDAGVSLSYGVGDVRLDAGRTGDLRVRCPGSTLPCRQAVVCAGNGTYDLVPVMAGLSRPSATTVVMARLPGAAGDPAMAIDFGSSYWRPVGGEGLIVAGGTSANAADPSRLHPVRRRADAAAVVARIAALFPGWPPGEPVSIWPAAFDATRSGRPLVGRAPSAGGVFVACGFAGHGIPGAFGVGRALARMIDGQDDPDLPAAWAPERHLEAEASS